MGDDGQRLGGRERLGRAGGLEAVHGGRDIKSTVHRVVRVKTPEPGDQGRLTAAYFLPLKGEASLDDPVTGVKGENASKWRSKRVRKDLKAARALVAEVRREVIGAGRL